MPWRHDVILVKFKSTGIQTSLSYDCGCIFIPSSGDDLYIFQCEVCCQFTWQHFSTLQYKSYIYCYHTVICAVGHSDAPFFVSTIKSWVLSSPGLMTSEHGSSHLDLQHSISCLCKTWYCGALFCSAATVESLSAFFFFFLSEWTRWTKETKSQKPLHSFLFPSL